MLVDVDFFPDGSPNFGHDTHARRATTSFVIFHCETAPVDENVFIRKTRSGRARLRSLLRGGELGTFAAAPPLRFRRVERFAVKR
jgi:hypothetical protein